MSEGQNSNDTTKRMTLNQAKQAWAKVDPFEVEFGDSNCRNFSLSTFKMKVRGAWSLSQMAQRPEGARGDVGAAMAAMPNTPGQRLAVSPEKMLAILHDPLEGDKALLDRIAQAMRNANRIMGALAPVPRSEMKLTPDTLKTLCHELLRKQEAGQLKVTQGQLPTERELEKLPGDEMYDPWNSSARKPKYKKDAEDWIASMD